MRFVRRKCSRAGDERRRDVLVDRRGVIYMSEANSGIYILSPTNATEEASMSTPTDIDRTFGSSYTITTGDIYVP